MRNASGVPHGNITYQSLGMSSGGFVDGFDIANDGWMCCRNDTTVGYIRGPTDLKWTPAFVAGGSLANANIPFKNPAQRTYEICFAPSNSLIMYAASGGLLWKSTDRAVSWVKQTGYKTGALDTTLSSTANESARHGGARLRVSPTDPTHVGLIHPTDGLYYSTDGGTTWTLSGSVTAPTSNAAGCVHFVSDTEVWVVTNGNLVRRSTTGVGGTFSTVSSGPSVAASISSGGGNVYIVGDSQMADTQLYMYSAGAFTQPTGILGGAVAVYPADTTKVAVIRAGGMFHSSTNSGGAWATIDTILAKTANDVPYLARSLSDFLALGQARYHPTTNQIIIANGIGVFTLNTIPPVVGTKLTSISKGIEMMLPKDVIISPNGTTLIPVEDKAGFVFTRANDKMQAAKQTPDNTLTLRQGGTGGMDYARDNEAYLALVHANPSGGYLSADAGATWAAMPTIPTFTYDVDGVGGSGTQTLSYLGGNIAVGNSGNMVWLTSSNWGPLSAGGIKYTLDGGTTWNSPTFGASVSMTGAWWHKAYYIRTRRLLAYKGAASTFYLFCNGTGLGNAADTAMTGLWKSTNGGVNWTKIMAGHFLSFNADGYQLKLRLNNNRAGHFFCAQGSVNSYPTAPYADGLYFSPDDGTNLYSATGALAGFWEPDDIAIGAKLSSTQAYETLYVLGRRGSATGSYGVYMCIDFDPTTRAGTWTLTKNWVLGKPDSDCVIGADPTIPGRIVVCAASGGGEVGAYTDTASGT